MATHAQVAGLVESALVGAVALGIMGVGPGLAAGLLVAWFRRRSRANSARDTERNRYVESLNHGTKPGIRFSIGTDDRHALVMHYSHETARALDPTIHEKLRTPAEQVFDETLGRSAAELRRHDFDKWIVQVNGETLLERFIQRRAQ